MCAAGTKEYGAPITVYKARNSAYKSRIARKWESKLTNIAYNTVTPLYIYPRINFTNKGLVIVQKLHV